jgi:hypothetical protein
MGASFAVFIWATGVGFVTVNAPAMSVPASDAQPRCRLASSKLPGAGGAQAICTAIERAITSRAPQARVSVEVHVLTPSMLAAAIVVNGRALPERRFAVTDRQLNPSSIQRFAESIATAVADAAER